ncbi:MAG: hypothetical protein ACTS3F_10035 [Phycisphaerales bacterium]
MPRPDREPDRSPPPGGDGDPSEPARLNAARRAIESLRATRVRPDRGVDLGTLVRREGADLQRTAKRLGAGGQAWAAQCPPGLLAHTSVLGLARGTLRIGVANSAARYALDRWLRTGGRESVIRQAGAHIRRITLVPHAPESEPPARSR